MTKNVALLEFSNGRQALIQNPFYRTNQAIVTIVLARTSLIDSTHSTLGTRDKKHWTLWLFTFLCCTQSSNTLIHSDWFTRTRFTPGWISVLRRSPQTTDFRCFPIQRDRSFWYATVRTHGRATWTHRGGGCGRTNSREAQRSARRCRRPESERDAAASAL